MSVIVCRLSENVTVLSGILHYASVTCSSRPNHSADAGLRQASAATDHLLKTARTVKLKCSKHLSLHRHDMRPFSLAFNVQRGGAVGRASCLGTIAQWPWSSYCQQAV